MDYHADMPHLPGCLEYGAGHDRRRQRRQSGRAAVPETMMCLARAPATDRLDLAPHGPPDDHRLPQSLRRISTALAITTATAGAHPFHIRTSTGLNVLVDGPRYVGKLVEFFEQRGGLDHVLLTHRDDVGASAKYAQHFGARLWIHENDREASPEATDILTGYDVTEPIPGVTVIPIPGHTIGSVAFLIDERLFVGDSR